MSGSHPCIRNCIECGIEFMRVSNSQKRCQSCNKEKIRLSDLKQSKEWRQKYPDKAKETNKKSKLKHKDKITEYAKKYYEEHKSDPKFILNRNSRTLKHYYANPTKAKARVAVTHAIRGGRLSKPILCEYCNQEKRLEGHHDDYNKPLEVKWLCKNCHETYHHQAISELKQWRDQKIKELE